MKSLLKNILLVVLLFSSVSGYSATRIATTTGNWSVPGTWDTPPVEGDAVQIASGVILTVDVNATCLSLTFGVSAAIAANTTLLVNNGVTLTVTNGITFRDPNPNVGCTQLVTVAGNLNVGTITYVNTSNATEINRITVTTGTLNVTGQIVIPGAADKNFLELTGTGTIKMGDISSPTNGTFTVTTGQNNNVWYTGTGANFRSVDYDNLYLQIPATAVANVTRQSTAGFIVNRNLVIESLHATNLSVFYSRNFNFTVLGTTSINSRGRFYDNNNTGINTFSGKVTINSGGEWLTTSLNNTANLIFQGGIQHDNTILTSFVADAARFNTNAQSISGLGLLNFGSNVYIDNIVVTNTADSVRINGTLDGLGSAGWTNGTNGVLNYDKATAMFNTSGTFIATAVGNWIYYGDGAAQNIEPNNYYNLGTAGGNTKTLQMGTTISGNLFIGTGTTLASGTNVHFVGGNFICNGTHTSSTGTYTFNGLSAQSIGGTTNPVIFNNLNISNTSGGVSLSQITRVTNTLTLASGLLTLNDKDFQLTSTGAAISGTPDATKMIVTNGTGSLVKTCSGASSFNFPIGTNSGSAEYTPLSMALTATTGSKTLSIRVTKGKDPNNPSGADYLNRYWTLSTPITQNMTATCTYITAPTSDVIGLEANCKGAYWNGTTWTKNAGFLSATPGTVVFPSTNYSTITSLSGVDAVVPTITVNSFTSNSTCNNAYAKTADVVTISFTASEPLWIAGTSSTIEAISSTIVNTSGNDYIATYTMLGSESAGNIPFSITPRDGFGNTGIAYTNVTTGKNVTFDITAPTLAQVNCVYNGVPASVQGGNPVSISPASGCPDGAASDWVWLAPAGTINFALGATMTRATGSANSITAPSTAGNYKAYILDAACNVSPASVATLTVTANAPPSFTSTPVTFATEAVMYTYNITTTDDNMASIIITCPTKPAWLTFTAGAPNSGTATLSGIAPGTTPHSVVLQVSDGGLSATQSFTITVGIQWDVPAEAPTIQAGIDSAAAGDLVVVAANTYYENINFHGKNIEVRGNAAAPANVTINGSASGSVVTFSNGEGNGAILNGFTLTNGSGTLATSCPYKHCPDAYYGGGIYISGSSPTLKNLVISNNVAKSNNYQGGSGGGVYAYGASPIFNTVTVSNNVSQIYRGGGICLDSCTTVAMVDVVITNNTGGNYGGAIFIFKSAVTITNTAVKNITGNTAAGLDGQGGGIYLHSSTLALKNVNLSGNPGTISSGIFYYSSPAYTNNGGNTYVP